MKHEETLAIIPARGGSKWIFWKNLVSLNGKPLIGYTIESAIDSGCFSRICISTDSPEIEKFALRYESVDVIRRPSILAQDDSKTIDTVIHAIELYKKSNLNYDVVVLLQPTSPLRDSHQIKDALNDYKINQNHKSLVSVCEVESHPFKCFSLSENNEIESLLGDTYLSQPRHLLPHIVKHNGAIYINRTEDLLFYRNFFIKPVYPFIMDKLSSVDIDTEIDLMFAEFYMNKKNNVKIQ